MQINQPKVSICSPCYNVAPYIGQFLDSLLAQTYAPLEIILVNDGSTDHTLEIINSYLPAFQSAGMDIMVISQPNQGQASAINNALKLVTGKYMAWPDPDDWLAPDSIERRVAFLESHPEVALVRGNVESVEDGTGHSLSTLVDCQEPAHEIKDMFHQLRTEQLPPCPVSCLLRTNILRSVIPDMDIYSPRTGGQNWQILLPLTYHYPSWQLPEVVGYYRVRQNSHSRVHNLNERIRYIDMCMDIQKQTLSTISTTSDLLRQVDIHFLWNKFKAASWQYPDSTAALAYLKQLRELGVIQTIPFIKHRILCSRIPTYIRVLYRRSRIRMGHIRRKFIH